MHGATLERVSPTQGAYYLAGRSEWSLTGGAVTYGKEDDGSRYVLLAMAPSFVGILTTGSLGWLSAHPLGPTRTMIRSGAISTKVAARRTGAADQFTKAFFEEDRLICERVQRACVLSRGVGASWSTWPGW